MIEGEERGREKENITQTNRDSKQRQAKKKLLTLNISSRRLFKHQAKISGHAVYSFQSS